tara:strand:- start:133 stop:495 length:363 start_codon:yes stop_codon:yes gene_type:complete
MGKIAIGHRAFKGNNRTTYLDQEVQNPVELNPNDPQDAVIIAQRARMIKDGDWDGLVQLQATSLLFTTKGENIPEKVGKRQVYVLTKNGKEFDHYDATTLETMVDQGFEVSGSKVEDIIA